MKTSVKFLKSLAVLFVFAISINGISQSEISNEDKTLSPYFFIQSDDQEADQLPLKSTSAKVNIAGVIADVRVTQEYKNEGQSPIEAIYVFPASTRAAVYSMKMTIGERVIEAKIKEKEQARADYEAAKSAGKSASLLEQHRPNVFQMNVANIMPGDLIKVEMFYTELLVPEEGVYEFVYPTVVGPRYSNETAEEAPEDTWVSNPYLSEGQKSTYTFDIEINLDAGMPVKDIRSTSHDFDFTYETDSKVTSSLVKGLEHSGNKDVVVQYRLQGNQIQSGVLLYEGEDENFFLAMMQPPKRVTTDEIPPREYVFIVDVSGSMNGFPLTVSKKLLKDLIGNLRPTDRFNVILFAGTSSIMSETSLPANQANIQKAINTLDHQRGGGGTNLLPAMKRALNLPGTENFSRTFVVVTDGYVTVEKEAFELIRNNLGEANFFAFGIGSSVNRHIIEGIAHVGEGESFVVLNQNEAPSIATRFRKYIQTPVLTNIELSFAGLNAYDVEPISVPDVLAERPVLIYGKYRGKANGKIVLSGTSGKGEYNLALDLNKVKATQENIALKYLWARQKIRMLDDFTNLGHVDEHKKEITDMGLKYNLLTNYTSFVAIDSEVRNADGNSTTVNQPLPLPEGVSNYAVGGVSAPTDALRRSTYGGNKKYRLQKGSSGTIGDGLFSNTITEAEESDVDELLKPDASKDKEKNETVYANADVMPKLNNNSDISAEIEKFIANHLQYPSINTGASITGKVFLEFVIDVDGSITNIKVIRSLHPDFDKEAIRVLKLTNKMWTPAKKGGKTVKMKYVVPVTFSK